MVIDSWDVDQLLIFWTEQNERVLALQQYRGMTEYDRFLELLIDILPKENTKQFVEETPYVDAVLSHPFLSLRSITINTTETMSPSTKNEIAAILFYRLTNMQFAMHEEDITDDILSVFQILKTSIRECPLLRTKEFYATLGKLVNSVTDYCHNADKMACIIQQAREYFDFQSSFDNQNKCVLACIVVPSTILKIRNEMYLYSEKHP